MSELPNYFFADMPPEHALAPTMVTEACQALKRNRERHLLPRSTDSIIELLCGVARDWLKPNDRFRRLALEHAAHETGFSHQTLARGLDSFFQQLTPENCRALILQDLGHPRRLDGFSASQAEQEGARASLARTPELLVHITAGNVPNAALMSICLGLLLRSAQFVKCATGTTALTRLFAHSLYEADRKLGSCLELARWRGGAADLQQALFNEADCVTATGTDQSLAAIRENVPSHVRFLGYGHRLSFGYIHRDMLGSSVVRVVERAASDVVAWNQLGCLSPHVIYVENGGVTPPERVAELLGQELARREESEPRGAVPLEIAAAISSRHSIYELRANYSRQDEAVGCPDTRLWRSNNSTVWTVVYEAEPRFQASCLHRFIYVKPVAHLTEALQSADNVRGKVSTVGVAAPEEHLAELASALAHWGVTRICPLGQMQNPPLTWRHDGRPALADFVTWSDWEKS